MNLVKAVEVDVVETEVPRDSHRIAQTRLQRRQLHGVRRIAEMPRCTKVKLRRRETSLAHEGKVATERGVVKDRLRRPDERGVENGIIDERAVLVQDLLPAAAEIADEASILPVYLAPYVKPHRVLAIRRIDRLCRLRQPERKNLKLNGKRGYPATAAHEVRSPRIPSRLRVLWNPKRQDELLVEACAHRKRLERPGVFDRHVVRRDVFGPSPIPDRVDVHVPETVPHRVLHEVARVHAVRDH